MKDSQKHITDSIHSWLAGELNAAEAAGLERHLETCPDCARAASESRAVWEALAGAAPQDSQLSMPSVWPKVRARTLAKRSRESWFYGSSALARSGLAATAVAAGLFVAVILPGKDWNSAQDLSADLSADYSGQQLESLWMEESSWSATGQDNDLDRLWIIAGLE